MIFHRLALRGKIPNPRIVCIIDDWRGHKVALFGGIDEWEDWVTAKTGHH
jgi:hypothetical protein